MFCIVTLLPCSVSWPQSMLQEARDEKKTFKYRFDSFGKKIKQNLRDEVDYLIEGVNTVSYLRLHQNVLSSVSLEM